MTTDKRVEKTKEEIKEVIEGILKVADKERKQSEPYKDMFKRTEGNPFCVQLREVESDMMEVVLNYTCILKENGYKVSNETFQFLYSLPLLVHVLEKDIVAKEGRAYSVDKVYRLLHQQLMTLLNKQ